jgi:hypothetical protein
MLSKYVLMLERGEETVPSYYSGSHIKVTDLTTELYYYSMEYQLSSVGYSMTRRYLFTSDIIAKYSQAFLKKKIIIRFQVAFLLTSSV